ncbi:GMC family oxidoreductase [Pseudosulfitobacter koreensis]|uniref:GMC family oxidoreductase n=1 Tax=Pseudosulfitobacter koreensis TaxID=2968472 RepID=A0ABT1YZR3_9RHOB|nr:GMC family oxidoreductase [Pseudosulfitobacter koreense]MCR8826361.1 GMC family oxidoreductase [Pseudosulfitobacter koreense]
MSHAHRPRAIDGQAPDVFSRDDTVPMRQFADTDEVDFAIVGTGCGGGVLAAKLAEAGFSVVAFDAGAFWRPLSDFASDEREQEKLYWLDPRISDGADPLEFGSNNSGRSVGGSSVHFQMVALRFRPEWFAARSRLGYAIDWPVDWREMWRYYDEVERACAISGPLTYPWGPDRGRYPYRAHEVNAAGQVLARGAEALGVDWAPTPLATVSAPRGKSPPCVYRGMCKIGCSTNAKQSVLVTYIPRALDAGAEIRDLAMVTRIATDRQGRATGVEYHRDGQSRFQKARNVVCAGYSIETPRLLLNSANARQPTGLANSSDTVGRYLMVHLNDAIWSVMDDEIRWYKGPPSMACCEHWNYIDDHPDKDFDGGYAFMSQGPLPTDYARTLVTNSGVFGHELRRKMALYNRMAGLKMVGETMPCADNRVTLAEETDAFGVPRAHVTYAHDDNDRRMRRHARAFMAQMLEAAGGRDLLETSSTAHLMGGCRMGADPETSVTDSDGRTWDVPNLWVCDGSLMPTGGGVNPSMTIMANAARIADRIKTLCASGTSERAHG